MDIESLRDVEAELLAISAALSPVLADLAAVLKTGDATDAELGRLNTALGDARDSLRDLRDALGAVDVADFQIGTDAGDRLQLWDWQLDQLRQQRAIVGQAIEAQQVAQRLTPGTVLIIPERR